jgi:hypothetical protein
MSNVTKMPLNYVTDRLTKELKSKIYEYVGQLNVAEAVGVLEILKVEIIEEQASE